MKISELIKRLESVKTAYGDIQVTVTGSHLPDGYFSKHPNMPDVFETTCEHVIVRDESEGSFGKKRARLYF